MPVEVTPQKIHPSKRGSAESTACQQRSSSRTMASLWHAQAGLSGGNRTSTIARQPAQLDPPLVCFADSGTTNEQEGFMTRIRTIAALTAVGALALPSAAFAALKVTGGNTQITASSAATTTMSANHLSVTPLAPATASG